MHHELGIPKKNTILFKRRANLKHKFEIRKLLKLNTKTHKKENQITGKLKTKKHVGSFKLFTQ